MMTACAAAFRTTCSETRKIHSIFSANRNVTDRRKDQIVRLSCQNFLAYAAKQLEITFLISLTHFKAFLKL